MKFVRAILRLVFFIFFTLLLIARVRWMALWIGMDMRRVLRVRQQWVKQYLFPALGVRIGVRGAPPDFPCILMANHRSYLDPIVICRDVPAFPVSKAEVASWPLVGSGAKSTGVLFVKRENPRSRKAALHEIGEKIAEGFSVILFPEGTTHANPATLPFRPGAFKIAAERSISIVPVALDYRDQQDYWLGDDAFLPHFLRRFGERYTDVLVQYGPAIQNNNPDAFIQEVQTQVDTMLAGIWKEYNLT